MTRDEFIADYCERSGVTWEKLQACGLDAYPCLCDSWHCKGWQMTFTAPDLRDDGKKP